MKVFLCSLSACTFVAIILKAFCILSIPWIVVFIPLIVVFGSLVIVSIAVLIWMAKVTADGNFDKLNEFFSKK